MKTLVLTPPSRETRSVVRDVLYGCWCKGKRIGGGTVPPYFQILATTILRADGHEADFLDAQALGLSLEEVVARSDAYDNVLVQSSTMTINEDADVLAALKRAHPHLFTVVFGSHATFMPKYTLAREGIDAVVTGEPDHILRDVVRARTSGNGAWREVPGVAFRNGSGAIHANGDYPLIRDLDTLPFADTSLLPPGIDYFNPLVERMPYMTSVTTRGCPAKCTYCTAPYFYGPRVRYRTAGNVVDEMAALAGRDFREVYFRDEVFTIKPKRVFEICDAIEERGLDLRWICNARVDMISRGMMERMKSAGCRVIKFGVESGVQKILDNIRKGATVEQARTAFADAREVGIETHAHFMLGMPGETRKTIDATIRFAQEIEPTTVSFGICTPYPGTPMFEAVARAYPAIRDGSDSDLASLHTEGLFNELYAEVDRPTLETSVREAYRRFYLRPTYWMRTARRIRSGADLGRLALAGSRVLDFAARGE